MHSKVLYSSWHCYCKACEPCRIVKLVQGYSKTCPCLFLWNPGGPDIESAKILLMLGDVHGCGHRTEYWDQNLKSILSLTLLLFTFFHPTHPFQLELYVILFLCAFFFLEHHFWPQRNAIRLQSISSAIEHAWVRAYVARGYHSRKRLDIFYNV